MYSEVTYMNSFLLNKINYYKKRDCSFSRQVDIPGHHVMLGAMRGLSLTKESGPCMLQDLFFDI